MMCFQSEENSDSQTNNDYKEQSFSHDSEMIKMLCVSPKLQQSLQNTIAAQFLWKALIQSKSLGNSFSVPKFKTSF